MRSVGYLDGLGGICAIHGLYVLSRRWSERQLCMRNSRDRLPYEPTKEGCLSVQSFRIFRDIIMSNTYSCSQKSAYSKGSASAKTL